MWSGFPLFPEQASTVAGRVDALYFFLIAVTIFFSVLIAGLIITFAIRFRRRSESEVPAHHYGSVTLEVVWTLIPLAIVFVIFAWALDVYFQLNRVPPDAMEVYVVGKRWMWKAQHLSGQREINELHVPVGVPVRLNLTSEDVIHSFYVPAFRIKKDAVPGRYNLAWFQATKPGRYHLFCAEYCGTKHSAMIGWVEVMEPAAFQAWLSGAASGLSLAAAGEKRFNELGCITCHRAASGARGPQLEGLFGKTVALANAPAVVADEGYIRESIVAPTAKIVAGYQPIMPTYQGLVDEEGLMQLVAYVQSLARPGEPGAAPPAAGASPSPAAAATPAPAGTPRP
jgi:cytochrome c oxidase subunit 2